MSEGGRVAASGQGEETEGEPGKGQSGAGSEEADRIGVGRRNLGVDDELFLLFCRVY